MSRKVDLERLYVETADLADESDTPEIVHLRFQVLCSIARSIPEEEEE